MSIVVVPYDEAWRSSFESLYARLWPTLQAHIVAIEHVGSTSVEGLAAKPILDVDIIIASRDVLPVVIEALRSLGYAHRGDLGIPDREAFGHEHELKHNLYVCVEGSLGLRNHLLLRDHLRANPSDRDAYGELKLKLAGQFADAPDAYLDGKTSFIVSILAKYALDAEALSQIEAINRLKT